MKLDASSVCVRRAKVEERQAVIDVIETAFSKPNEPRHRLSEEMPHLFHDTRLANHFIGEQAGKITGVVGLYPHQIRIHDVVFDVGGVGQVATLPEARGGGVMSGILKEVCRAADELDFSWLFGDRQRYGRYGWEHGGARHQFETYDRYLPPVPPSGQVHSFEPGGATARLQAALARQPQAMLFSDREVELLLNGARGKKWRGWSLGESFVLQEGDSILFGDGRAEELVGLLAHVATELRQLPGDHWKLHVTCDGEVTPLYQTCRRCYWTRQIAPAASFRIGNLHRFLSKACRLAQPAVNSGSDCLALVNTDNGQQATLYCTDGRLTVEEGAGPQVHRFTTRELSEICFGLSPLDALLPDLPAASPLRRVLPVPVGINRIFSL